MKNTARRTNATRLLAGIVAAATMTAATPAIAQTDGGSSAQAAGIAAVDGLRVARAEGTLAVLNWRTLPEADLYQVRLDGRVLTSENGWTTVRFLEPMKTYTASVRAVVDGQIGPSETVTFTTTDVTLRDPRLVVDAGVFRLSRDLVPFAWEPAPFTTIELFRDGVQLDADSLGDFTSRLLDRDVKPGDTHVYQARLVSDASGAVGPFGPELTVTVPGGAPALTIPYADNSVAVLRIEGMHPNSAIDIERDGQYIGVFPRSGGNSVAWFGDRELSPFVPRTYRVREVGPFGEVGPWSDPVTSVFTGVPIAS